MCLSIPGKVISISEDKSLLTGKVQFGHIVKECSLAFVPDVKIDDYVIVHAGIAINKMNEDDANQVFEYLEEIL